MVTFSPIVNVVKFEQEWNIGLVEVPISVHFSALKDTEVSPSQALKTEMPMEVIEAGIVTDVSPSQKSKAQPPMMVTEFGILTH